MKSWSGHADAVKVRDVNPSSICRAARKTGPGAVVVCLLIEEGGTATQSELLGTTQWRETTDPLRLNAMKSSYINHKGSDMPARDLSRTKCNAFRGPWPR